MVFFLQNIRIDTVFPGEYFEILESSLNGSYHRVKALKEGLTLIDATLRAIVDEVSLIATMTLISVHFSWSAVVAHFFYFSRESMIISCGLCSVFRPEGSTHSPTQSTMNRMWRSITP